MSSADIKAIPLKGVASYSKDRIDVSELDLDNYVGVDNLNQNKRGKTTATYIPEKGRTTMYRGGDILISNIRPYLKKIWYATNSGGSSADVLTLRVNQEFDSKFIYYNLLKDEFFDFVMLGSKGTRMPRGNKQQLLDFPIPAFPLAKQNKIASTLSDIDAKIELNNKTNAELEKMAKTLYDYWFVQFDFPNENGKPYKSSGGEMVWNDELKREIPEGWEVKNLSDLLPVITGKQDANFATEDGRYNFFTCGEEILKCDTYEFEGKAVLVAGNGNFNIKLYEGEFNAYQRTYVLIPNNPKYYTTVYMAAKNRIEHLTSGSRGSIVKFITKGDLENIQLALPKSDQGSLFSTINTITAKIERNIEENHRLAELRDWLLPMLMNGQVVVK